MSDNNGNTADYTFSQPIGLWKRRGADAAFIQLATSNHVDTTLMSHLKEDEEGFHVWHYWAQGPHPEQLFFDVRKCVGASLDFHCAHNLEHPLYRTLLRNKTQAAQLWISEASYPKQPLSPHDTYWHAIAWNGNKECFDQFHETICTEDLNRTDSNGFTAAVIAVHRGDIDFVKQFLFLGIDPDIPDLQNKVLLHHVAQYGDINFYTQMQDLGASDNIKNDRGFTPMDILRDRMKHGTQTDIQTLKMHWERRYFQKTMF